MLGEDLGPGPALGPAPGAPQSGAEVAQAQTHEPLRPCSPVEEKKRKNEEKKREGEGQLSGERFGKEKECENRKSMRV